jgi:Rieske Fe-S protein
MMCAATRIIAAPPTLHPAQPRPNADRPNHAAAGVGPATQGTLGMHNKRKRFQQAMRAVLGAGCERSTETRNRMHELERPDGQTFSRRNVLAAGAFGASAIALSACAKAKTPSAAAGTTSTQATSTPVRSTSPSPTSAASTSAASGTAATTAALANTVAKLSDINVGEAIAATDSSGAHIIVARPTTTTVAAFSAVCTHQGCAVSPAGKRLDCPCHGSVFDATTGEVLQGPASRALDRVNVTLSGNNIVAG